MDYGTLNPKIRQYDIELKLFVLEVLQGVGSKFIFMKLVDIYHRFTKEIRMVALLMMEMFNLTTIEEKNEC